MMSRARLLVLVGCAVLLGTAIVQDAVMGTGCVLPHMDTKKCYTAPENKVDSCAGLWLDTCDSKSLYTINDFPKDEEKTECGYDATKEVPRDCWQERSCVWDGEQCPAVCIPDPDGWSPWYQMPKIEEDGDMCEDPEEF